MKFLVLLFIVYFVNVLGAFGDVDMTTFPATSGFTINGPFANAYLMSKSAGDVNGDGLKDLILYWAASPLGRTSAGAFYCLFGKRGATPYSTIASSALTTGSSGFFVYQAAAGDYNNYYNTFGTAGDVNNDGFDDLLLAIGVGDPTGRADAGITYIIFGHSTSSNFTTVDLQSFTTSASTGVRILGPTAGQHYGMMSINAGDINGDGYDEVMIGSGEANAYMIFGKSSWSADVDLNGMTSNSFGFLIVGFWEGMRSMGDVGDYNGDGYADYAFGMNGNFNGRQWSGGQWIVFGHSSATAFASLETVNFPSSNTLGFRVYGAANSDDLGNKRAVSLDFNADGSLDLLLASSGADNPGNVYDVGAAYVIFGKRGLATYPNIDLLGFAFGTLGFKVIGANANAYLGSSIRSLGDFNGDGISDIEVGASDDDFNGRTNSGTIYVFYGHKNTTSFATIDTSTFTSGALGFRIFGPTANERTGDRVWEAGDFNGDGTVDMIMTCASASSNAGRVQVFYGVGPPTAGPTPGPTKLPTLNPSALPTITPSCAPSVVPSAIPSTLPTTVPTVIPTVEPSCAPTVTPTALPSTAAPSALPTGPTSQPSSQPSVQPSRQPSAKPSCQPSGSPSSQPSSQPSLNSATFALIQSSPTYKLRNGFSFAALSSNGSVYTWGEAPRGGDSSAVQHLLAANVTQVVHGKNAFAALKTDGSIVPWGVPMIIRGATVYFAAALVANEAAFAGMSAVDGAVFAFGSVHHGGDVLDNTRCNGYSQQLSSGVQSITASAGAFTALKSDGTVYTWGNRHAGADVSSAFLANLQGCTLVVATRSAFAVLLRSGRVTAWGGRFSGGDTSAVNGQLTEIVHIVAAAEAFVAFKKDSSLVTWGYHKHGGDSSAVAAELSANVTFVAHTGSAFSALKSDGTVAAWGKADSGGDASAAQGALTDVVFTVGNTRAFVALTSAGGVVAWGKAAYGGQIPSNKANALSSGVVSIYHTDRAFAALKTDGSVVVWGQAGHGGSPGAAVEAHLASGVHTICSNDVAFSVIKTDGSVVGWGHPVSIPAAGELFTSTDMSHSVSCA